MNRWIILLSVGLRAYRDPKARMTSNGMNQVCVVAKFLHDETEEVCTLFLVDFV